MSTGLLAPIDEIVRDLHRRIEAEAGRLSDSLLRTPWPKPAMPKAAVPLVAAGSGPERVPAPAARVDARTAAPAVLAKAIAAPASAVPAPGQRLRVVAWQPPSLSVPA
jgi:hypothetical protein